MFTINSSSNQLCLASFSTSIVFFIDSSSSNNDGGFSIVFITSRAEPQEHVLQNFNCTNHTFNVEFDRDCRFNNNSENYSKANHVSLNINDKHVSEPAVYFEDDDTNGHEVEMSLQSGEVIRAWIEYDGMQRSLR